jgi:hypothetical protein
LKQKVLRLELEVRSALEGRNMSSLPNGLYPVEPIRLLSARAMEDEAAALRRALSDSQWQVDDASSGQDARSVPGARMMPVVVRAFNLFDRQWKAFLAGARQMLVSPRLMLSTHREGIGSPETRLLRRVGFAL